jgi:hypothetical protein
MDSKLILEAARGTLDGTMSKPSSFAVVTTSRRAGKLLVAQIVLIPQLCLTQ